MVTEFESLSVPKTVGILFEPPRRRVRGARALVLRLGPIRRLGQARILTSIRAKGFAAPMELTAMEALPVTVKVAAVFA